MAPGHAQEAAAPARDSAILAKLQGKNVRVLDQIALEQPKTKNVVTIFKALGIDRSCLLALAEPDQLIERSARNIHRTTMTTVAQLNAWDILRNKTLLLTKAGLEKILA